MVFSKYFVGIKASWIQFWSTPKSISAMKIILKSSISSVIKQYHFWKLILEIKLTSGFKLLRKSFPISESPKLSFCFI